MLVECMGRGQALLSLSSPLSPPVGFSPLQVECIKILKAEISGRVTSSFPAHLIASALSQSSAFLELPSRAFCCRLVGPVLVLEHCGSVYQHPDIIFVLGSKVSSVQLSK